MTNDTIIKTVKKECNGKCFVDFYKAESSESLYFRISKGDIGYCFRISDHPTKCVIKSFTVSKNTKTKSVARFVSNCIRRMNKKSLFKTFEEINVVRLNHLVRV